MASSLSLSSFHLARESANNVRASASVAPTTPILIRVQAPVVARNPPLGIRRTSGSKINIADFIFALMCCMRICNTTTIVYTKEYYHDQEATTKTASNFPAWPRCQDGRVHPGQRCSATPGHNSSGARAIAWKGAQQVVRIVVSSS